VERDPRSGRDKFFGEGLRSMSLDWRRELIDRAHPALSIVHQCELMSISRSGLYYQPVGETPALMRVIDDQFLETPWHGRRQMVRQLRRDGHGVGRERVRRLMRLMGLAAIYQRPRANGVAPRASGASLSAAGSADRSAQSGLMCRHYVCSDASRLSLSPGGNGLGDTQGLVTPTV
jgi:hypothetical protein